MGLVTALTLARLRGAGSLSDYHTHGKRMKTNESKSRRLESDIERADRLKDLAGKAAADALAEEAALDAAVRRSIAIHGA